MNVINIDGFRREKEEKEQEGAKVLDSVLLDDSDYVANVDKMIREELADYIEIRV
jgi:hypothetical protein